MDSRHADVVEARHRAPHELRRDAGLLRDGNVGGPGGHHEDGTPGRLRRISDRHDRRLLMVRHPLSDQRLPKASVHVGGGPRRQDEPVRFRHPAGDLDDALGRLAEAEDHLRESATEIPMRIQLGESQILVRQVA